VIATGSTAAKRDLAIKAGADLVVDPAIPDLKSRVRELTDGRGVDVVYDTAGGAVSEPALRALAFDGRYCVVGFPGGVARVALNLVLLNNRTMLGIETHGWATRFENEKVQLLGELLSAVSEGRLHPTAPAVRPLAEAAQVMEDLLQRRVSGRTVLAVNS
jgi:NADPH2:quinone reductase